MPGARRIKVHYKKQLGNVAKLKGNIFYGKMIEDLGRHKSTKFTVTVFDNLEEIGGAYEIKELKRSVMIKRPYQCGIAVHHVSTGQAANVRILL